MRKRDLALLLLVCAVVAGTVVLQFMTRNAQLARDATLATIETPKQVRFYQDLAANAPEVDGGGPAAAPPVAQSFAGPCGSPQAIMEQWAGLFEEATQWTDTGFYRSVFELSNKPPLDMYYEEAKAMEDFFDRVRALAPCGGPLYPLAFPEVYQEDSPHWAALSDIEQLLRADAYVAADQGDNARVVSNLIAVMQMADALTLEPLPGAQAFRHYFYEWAVYTYKEIHDDLSLPSELLARFSVHLAQAHHREGLYAGLAGEPNRTIHVFESWRSRSYFSMLRRESIINATRSRLWRSTLCEPFFLEDERSALEFLERIAALPNAPFYEIKPELDRIRNEIDALPITRNQAKGPITWLLNNAFQRQARHEIGVDLWRLRLLAERYRAETGALPESLEEAAARFGESLPLDPGNGKPYLYEPEGDCFVLTSSGVRLVGGLSILLEASLGSARCPE